MRLMIQTCGILAASRKRDAHSASIFRCDAYVELQQKNPQGNVLNQASSDRQREFSAQNNTEKDHVYV
jgi:hypothetical protein